MLPITENVYMRKFVYCFRFGIAANGTSERHFTVFLFRRSFGQRFHKGMFGKIVLRTVFIALFPVVCRVGIPVPVDVDVSDFVQDLFSTHAANATSEDDLALFVLGCGNGRKNIPVFLLMIVDKIRIYVDVCRKQIIDGELFVYFVFPNAFIPIPTLKNISFFGRLFGEFHFLRNNGFFLIVNVVIHNENDVMFGFSALAGDA